MVVGQEQDIAGNQPPPLRRRGQTLLETLVSLGLLSLLMMLMFAVYRMGANAWMKGDAQVSLIQDLRVVTDRLAREVERSAYESATLDPGPNNGTALAFMSSWDEATQRYDYDPAVGSPVWHRYLVCYYDAPAREVRWVEVDLATPTTTAAPLPGLAGYRSGGRVLASQVDRCDFILTESLLETRLETSRKRYGSDIPEKLQLDGAAFFRN